MLLNAERVLRAPDDPAALDALEAALHAHRASVEPLELWTGELDDQRQRIEYPSALHAEALTAFREQDSWSDAEHRAYFSTARLRLHPRPRGGGRANVEATAFGYAHAVVAGVPESAMPAILGRSETFLQRQVRPIASAMLQELGERPLAGCEPIDVASLPHRYPRIERAGSRRRRYLPLLATSPFASLQTRRSRDTLLVEILPRVNAWLAEHPRAKGSLVEELVERWRRPDDERQRELRIGAEELHGESSGRSAA